MTLFSQFMIHMTTSGILLQNQRSTKPPSRFLKCWKFRGLGELYSDLHPGMVEDLLRALRGPSCEVWFYRGCLVTACFERFCWRHTRGDSETQTVVDGEMLKTMLVPVVLDTGRWLLLLLLLLFLFLLKSKLKGCWYVMVVTACPTMTWLQDGATPLMIAAQGGKAGVMITWSIFILPKHPGPPAFKFGSVEQKKDGWREQRCNSAKNQNS